MSLISEIKGKTLVQSTSVKVTNPVDGTYIGSVPQTTEAEIKKTVQLSKEAWKQWRKVPVYHRAELLYRYSMLIKKQKEDIAVLECNEMGKRIIECRGEVTDACRVISGYAERVKHLYSEVIPTSQPGIEKDIIYTIRESIGPVACIVPFNYPLELYAHKVAPAIAAGNPVIVKPASTNPLAVKRLVEIGQKVGFPENLIQFVSGSGSKVGKWLVVQPEIAAVSLTGSTAVGVQLLMDAAPNMHRVYLELGGNDACIIMDDADIQYAVKEALAGRLQNTGQTCCAPKRFIVHNSIKDEFASLLTEELKKVKIGDPIDIDSELSCLISEPARDKVLKQIEDCKNEGADVFWGGEAVDQTFMTPAVLTNVSVDSSVATDMEIFGPVFPIIGFDSDEEAVNIANSSIYGLSGGVISRDTGRALRTAAKMECGTTVIGGSGLYRTTDMPFGGYKKSGLGREGMLNTLEEMSQLKTIVLKNIM